MHLVSSYHIPHPDEVFLRSQEELQQQSNARTRRMESLLVELDLQKKGAWVREVLSKGGFHHNNEYNSCPFFPLVILGIVGDLFGSTAPEWECFNYFPQPCKRFHFGLSGRSPHVSWLVQNDGHSVAHPSCPDIVKFCELYPDQILELFNLCVAAHLTDLFLLTLFVS
jgi:hypothetical protein